MNGSVTTVLLSACDAEIGLAERHVAQHDARVAEVFVGDALDVGRGHGLRLRILDAERVARVVEERLIVRRAGTPCRGWTGAVEELKLLARLSRARAPRRSGPRA